MSNALVYAFDGSRPDVLLRLRPFVESEGGESVHLPVKYHVVVSTLGLAPQRAGFDRVAVECTQGCINQAIWQEGDGSYYEVLERAWAQAHEALLNPAADLANQG